MTKTKIEDKKIAKRRGRPPRYGQGRASLHVRFTPERTAILKGLADAAGRSVSEQVEFVVERYFAELAFRQAERLDARLRDNLTRQQVKEMLDNSAERMLAETRKLFEGIKR